MYNHFFPWRSLYTHTFIDIKATWGKRTCPRFETASVGFELGTSGFRDRRSYPLSHSAPLHSEVLWFARHHFGPLFLHCRWITDRWVLFPLPQNAHGSVFFRENRRDWYLLRMHLSSLRSQVMRVTVLGLFGTG